MSVESSDAKGRYVIAKEQIEEGRLIMRYLGVVTDTDPQNAHTFSLVVNGKDVFIDGATACGAAAYVASSLSPNASSVREALDGEARVSIVSIKPIAVDEEITIFYLGKKPSLTQLKQLEKHRYVSIREYDNSCTNRSFVCCNRTVWAPANDHKRGSSICSECSKLAEHPVGFCTQWCFDQHIYAISTGDAELTIATSARRRAHNVKTYHFGNPEYHSD